jgi:hypothetical protein
VSVIDRERSFVHRYISRCGRRGIFEPHEVSACRLYLAVETRRIAKHLPRDRNASLPNFAARFLDGRSTRASLTLKPPNKRSPFASRAFESRLSGCGMSLCRRKTALNLGESSAKLREVDFLSLLVDRPHRGTRSR